MTLSAVVSVRVVAPGPVAWTVSVLVPVVAVGAAATRIWCGDGSVPPGPSVGGVKATPTPAGAPVAPSVTVPAYPGARARDGGGRGTAQRCAHRAGGEGRQRRHDPQAEAVVRGAGATEAEAGVPVTVTSVSPLSSYGADVDAETTSWLDVPVPGTGFGLNDGVTPAPWPVMERVEVPGGAVEPGDLDRDGLGAPAATVTTLTGVLSDTSAGGPTSGSVTLEGVDADRAARLVVEEPHERDVAALGVADRQRRHRRVVHERGGGRDGVATGA